MDYQRGTPSTTPSYNGQPVHLQDKAGDAQENAKTQSVLGRSFLIGTLVILAVFGMLAVLLTYLCVFHKCMRLSRVLISTAPLGKVLTISQLASRVVAMTISIVMGLFAYQLGAQWIHSSTASNSNRPSPLQFGLLMSICNGASIAVLWRALTYIFKVGDPARKQNLPAPRLLSRAIYLLFYLLVLSYLATAADTWFHATSTTMLIQSRAPFDPKGLSTAFGREINSTRCNEASQNANNLIRATCDITNGLAAHDAGPISQGLTALANSSTAARVAFTDDRIAILIPPNIPSNITYTAQTVGLKASCRSITSECLAPQPPPVGYGGGCCLNLNCKGPTVFNLTLPGTDVSGPLDAQGNPIEGYNIPTNPFNLGVAVNSLAYTGTQDTFLNNTGWFVHGNAGAYDVMYCNVAAVDVAYTYTSERFVTATSTPTPVQDARYIISAGYEDGLAKIEVVVEGVGSDASDPDAYEAAFGLELTRRWLGLGAAIYQESQALSVNQELTTIGSKFDLIPFVLLVFAIAAYGMVVLSILLQTVISAAGVPYVQLASSYFTDPLTTVHALYGPVEPALTWENEAMAKFAKEGEEDRLFVGPVATGLPNQNAFAVARKWTT